MNDDSKNAIHELINLVGSNIEKATKYKNQMREYINHDIFREAVSPFIEILKLEIFQYQKEQSEKIENNTDEQLYLAHYTSVETIHSILKNYKEGNFLRLYGAFSMNDPSEGVYLRDQIADKYRWLMDAKRHTDAFICSFVSGKHKIGDKVTYWQSYGKDGLGCSIEFPLNYLPNHTVCRVLYGEKKVGEIKEKLENYFKLGSELHKLFPNKEEKEHFATTFGRCLMTLNLFTNMKAMNTKMSIA